MISRIHKLGNSLALRIPKFFANEVGLQKETSVEVSIADCKLIITFLIQPEVTLDELLSNSSEGNVYNDEVR